MSSTKMDSDEQFESGLAELNELADRHIESLKAAVAGSEPAAAVELLERAAQQSLASDDRRRGE